MVCVEEWGIGVLGDLVGGEVGVRRGRGWGLGLVAVC